MSNGVEGAVRGAILGAAGGFLGGWAVSLFRSGYRAASASMGANSIMLTVVAGANEDDE